ncbi:MAG: hypothetical protein ONB05_11980, partial [candidate division KSB1 bacterium]|nr:hypothetical protein [candidate division KSB1 bacterium]
MKRRMFLSVILLLLMVIADEITGQVVLRDSVEIAPTSIEMLGKKLNIMKTGSYYNSNGCDVYQYRLLLDPWWTTVIRFELCDSILHKYAKDYECDPREVYPVASFDLLQNGSFKVDIISTCLNLVGTNFFMNYYCFYPDNYEASDVFIWFYSGNVPQTPFISPTLSSGGKLVLYAFYNRYCPNIYAYPLVIPQDQGTYIIKWRDSQYNTILTTKLVLYEPEQLVTKLVKPIDSGDRQVAPLNSQLANSLKVKVVDKHGNGIECMTVDFAVATKPAGATGESFSQTEVKTNSNGVAETYFTIGDKPGEYTITATCAGVDESSPQIFTVFGVNYFEVTFQPDTMAHLDTVTITVQAKDENNNNIDIPDETP